VALKGGITMANDFRTFTPDEIQPLSEDQKAAILEALVVAIYANARVGQDESHRLKEEVIRIPWGEGKDPVIERAKKAQATFDAHRSDQGHVEMLNSIASRLPPSPTIREKLIAMMGRVMGAADHSVDAQEQNTLSAYAVALGVTPERFKAIVDSIGG
jgi:uncharacterized tellurite resistance protein B-like protein